MTHHNQHPAHPPAGEHRPSTPWLSYLLAAVLIGVAAAWVAYSRGWLDGWLNRTERAALTVRIGQHAFAVELAMDEQTAKKGLSYREDIPADTGMLFAFPRPRPGGDEHAFWMKNCLVDLDIAFISPDRRIVTIWTMKAQPPGTPSRDLVRYPPTAEHQYALEVRAGEFARRGIEVGDKVEFSEDVKAAIKAAR